eukprot:904396-Prorocentrum_minimum.AAC.4
MRLRPSGFPGLTGPCYPTYIASGWEFTLSNGDSCRGQRFAVRCRAEQESKKTLSNLDALLGIEPEPEKPPRAERKVEAAPPPPSPPQELKAKATVRTAHQLRCNRLVQPPL